MKFQKSVGKLTFSKLLCVKANLPSEKKPNSSQSILFNLSHNICGFKVTSLINIANTDPE